MTYRLPIIVIGASCLAACQENHSVLAPHGPVAEDIATLAWVLLAVAAVVVAIVGAALSFALRGPARARKWIANQRTIIALGIIFPAVVLSFLLFVGLRLTGALASSEAKNAIRIEVTGEQWWWRVRYRTASGQIVEGANEVRIPAGQDIVFQLKSADVIHSFWIPSLAGKADMIPGRVTSLRLAAHKPGIYRGLCAEYCGGPHAFMAFDVIAMSIADYESWLEKASSVPMPSTDDGRRGEALFTKAGCSGCHAVDGTAQGMIGPNLTTLGGRRSIAAGLMPMSEGNLARFIVDGPHLKRDNKMPPFRIFNDDEMRALTAYLGGLK
jgi:cytochrome c oxidase subunit 2